MDTGVLGHLEAITRNLAGCPGQRAAELAAPQVGAASARHREKIAGPEAANQRPGELAAALRRHLAARKDQSSDAYRDIVTLLDIAPPDDPLVKAITCRQNATIERVRREASGEGARPS